VDFLDLAVGPAPQLPRAAFEKRRARIAKQLGEGKVLAVATHAETVHSNDVHHSFRPHSDFWYLTGFAEPESVLLLQGNGETTLFLRPRKPEAEVWTGRRLGLERAPDVLGVDRVESFEDLAAGLLKFPEGPIEAIASHHPAVLETLKNTGRAIGDGRELLAEARLRKDAAELELMQKAADVAIAGHRAAAELVQPGQRLPPHRRHRRQRRHLALRRQPQHRPGRRPSTH
jgi:Xaa-Pro aminopeptidase